MKASLALRSLLTAFITAATFNVGLAQEAKLELVALSKVGQNPGNTLQSWAMTDVSDDGSTIVGRYVLANGKVILPPDVPVDFVWRPDEGGLKTMPAKDGRGRIVKTDDNGEFFAFLGPAPTVLIYDRATDTLQYTASIPGVTNPNALKITKLADDGKSFSAWRDPSSLFDITEAFTYTNHTTTDPKYVPYSLPFFSVNGTINSSRYRWLDVNNDGSAVLGVFVTPANALPPPGMPSFFRYVEDGVNKAPLAMVLSMGVPAAASTQQYASSVVVGRIDRANKGPIGAMWLPDAQIPVSIAIPPGGNTSQLLDVNGNGEVAVGWFTTPTPDDFRALVWIKPRGSRDLATILSKFGVAPPTGVTLRSARFVSDDGRKIAGLARGADGTVYLYRATIPQSEICYANCDGSMGPNYLNAADIACFQQRMAAKHFYTNADNSVDVLTGKPTFDANDMAVFMQRYEQGCPE
jgi:hypothetical protein